MKVCLFLGYENDVKMCFFWWETKNSGGLSKDFVGVPFGNLLIEVDLGGSNMIPKNDV